MRRCASAAGRFGNDWRVPGVRASRRRERWLRVLLDLRVPAGTGHGVLSGGAVPKEASQT